MKHLRLRNQSTINSWLKLLKELLLTHGNDEKCISEWKMSQRDGLCGGGRMNGKLSASHVCW